MQIRDGRLRSSPTDLANFLGCRHKTLVDSLAARGRIEKPTWQDPLAAVLRDRGEAHERAYVARLRSQGLTVVDLTLAEGAPRPWPDEAIAQATASMRSGADVIVQAALGGVGVGGPVTGAMPHWFGYADVLRRIDGDSQLGDWHYEVHDTKLTRETRGGAILQLLVYTDLVSAIQGRRPEHLRVVTPAADEAYRADDFAAFYRSVVADYAAFLQAHAADADEASVYPDPVEHCDVCRWWERCNRRRREDDHLRFVAGLGRSHQAELVSRDVSTLAALAAVPLPMSFRPKRGSKETYARLREQARVQAEEREIGQPVYELLPTETEDFGLRFLPAPSPGDLFLDFEGDPFGRPDGGIESGDMGREYLVGLGRIDASGQFSYQVRWAFDDAAERALFEWLVDELSAAVAADPGAYIYHYAPYEPSAVRRLVSRYATRETDVDALLRAGRFVDLYGIVRRSIRAGVEHYSIKDLEPLYGFTREVDLERAGDQRRVVEVALETGNQSTVTPDALAAVEGYNRDDCRSTENLRDWLERLRAEVEAGGVAVARPVAGEGAPSEPIKERDRQAAARRAKLLARVPPDGPASVDDHAIWRLAYLVDFHRREERVAWGEYHRLRAQPTEDLVDEPLALVGLTFAERVAVPAPGSRAKRVTDRYQFPPQECDLRKDADLRLPDDTPFGAVVIVDRVGGTLDVIKTAAATDVHPPVVIGLNIVRAQAMEDSLGRLADVVGESGLDDAKGQPLVNDLLLARPPRVRSGAFAPLADESATDFAVRIVADLDDSLLAIQGPPGAGKTFTGARMISALVCAGKRVGVVASGHAVIRKLVADTVALARSTDGFVLPAAHLVGKGDLFDDLDDGVTNVVDNGLAQRWLGDRTAGVLGGTPWMWSREEFAGAVDVLFVDEAGQMSLANALAVSQATRSLVLLGDPQQLDQPQQGSHPDGVGASALEHILGDHATIPEDRGIFLPETWRLAPAISGFTSELFYEGRLRSRAGRERQRLDGAPGFAGAGLRLVEVDHDGCRNASDVEVDEVDRIVLDLLAPGVTWTDHEGVVRPMTPDEILVVAPFNAQVARLRDRLSPRGVSAGTVDKFQGQEAAVVIYSMTVSRPDDAPRGMRFLYNRNRLNVATSRAKCLCILVASPRLFEPECHMPDEMRLANALCRYRELARANTVGSGSTRNMGPGALAGGLLLNRWTGALPL